MVDCALDVLVLDAAAFNRSLWRGVKGEDKPYPVRPTAHRDEDDDRRTGDVAARK